MFSIPLQEPKYKPNQTILKQFGTGENSMLKITNMRWLRTAGIEDDKPKPEKGSVNSEKLEDNISRAKRMIFEYAYCNPWEFFFTGTLDKTKYNRTDLQRYHKDLTKWIRNYSRKLDKPVKYILIPELHKDGENWHIHGLIHGLPLDCLTQFKNGDKMSKRLSEKVFRGDVVYNWSAYAKKYGYCSLEPIRNHEAVSKYITKYITKGLLHGVSEIGAHMYYCSRGLQKAVEIKKGSMSLHIEPDYVGEYASVTWLNYSPQLKEHLKNSIY